MPGLKATSCTFTALAGLHRTRPSWGKLGDFYSTWIGCRGGGGGGQWSRRGHPSDGTIMESQRGGLGVSLLPVLAHLS